MHLLFNYMSYQRTLVSWLFLTLFSFVALQGCQNMAVHPINKNIGPKQYTAQPHIVNQIAEIRQQKKRENISQKRQQYHSIKKQSDNLWDVIRMGMKLKINPANKRIAKELKVYAHNQYYFNKIVERATPYLYYIVAEAKQRNIPLEIVLLPVVESAFDPFAFSSAGATGLWQIMPNTGVHLQLVQNWWYDGRRDILTSTSAALDYIKELRALFNDWDLALAAYNSGPARVQKAVRRNIKRKKVPNFWYLNLPEETTSYVPKLLAISWIIRHPKKYGIQLPFLKNNPYFSVASTLGQIDMHKIADLTNIPVKKIYAMNPGINKWATPPNIDYQIIIPGQHSAKKLQKKLNNLPIKERIQWRRHSVIKGDSLIAISQFYNTEVSLIKKMNQLNSNSIHVGQKLLIPLPNKQGTSKNVAQRIRAISALHEVNHMIKVGDTLWGISRKYHVAINDILKWNHMSKQSILRIGDQLSIFLNKPGKVAREIRKIYYKIRANDSISLIGNKFNVSIKDIKKWNKLTSNRLHKGQTLILYINILKSSV